MVKLDEPGRHVTAERFHDRSMALQLKIGETSRRHSEAQRKTNLCDSVSLWLVIIED
jgi:hypothetical protein